MNCSWMRTCRSRTMRVVYESIQSVERPAPTNRMIATTDYHNRFSGSTHPFPRNSSIHSRPRRLSILFAQPIVLSPPFRASTMQAHNPSADKSKRRRQSNSIHESTMTPMRLESHRNLLIAHHRPRNECVFAPPSLDETKPCVPPSFIRINSSPQTRRCPKPS